MEWISINTVDPEMKKYHLFKDDDVQVVLKYNLLQQSIRMSGRGKQQVFFMESGSMWNNRMVFKNAYGIEVGRFLFNNRTHAGRIQIEGTALQIAMVENDSISVILYEHDKHNPLLECRLPEGRKEQTVPIDNLERACLFLGLCWYVMEKDAPVVPLKKRG
jgi:hypothetical protein